MRNKNFAVFILSHGRANKIKTVDMLKRFHYTGDWFVVIDNEDDQEELYRNKFGDHIIQFDKRDYVSKIDLGDMDTDRRVGVFARNFIQDEAERLGYECHLQLDDDFSEISIRYADNDKLQSMMITDLDAVFDACLDLFLSTPLTALSFALSSDYIGGVANDRFQSGMFRKTMGSFFLKAKDKVKFVMRMNDDITSCVLYGSRGKLFYSISSLQVITPATQHDAGGMTDIYKKNGTYRKSFYSVMCCPSFVKVSAMGITDFRIHHAISWNNAVPKLLSERWCKHERH